MKKFLIAILIGMPGALWGVQGITLYDNSNIKYSQIQSPTAYGASYRIIMPTNPGMVGQAMVITGVSGSTMTTAFSNAGGGGTNLGFIVRDSGSNLWAITVSTTGHLVASSASALAPGYLAPNGVVMTDQVGGYWTLASDTGGHITIIAGGSYDSTLRSFTLVDSNYVSWIISVNNTGHLIVNDGTQSIDGANGINGVQLPATSGSIGQCVAQVSSSSWGYTTCGSGGTPGGSSSQFQYNNGGSFAGSANLTVSGNAIDVNGSGGLVVAGAGAGQFTATEGYAVSGASGSDILYANSTTHSVHSINNNGPDLAVPQIVVGSLATLQSTTVTAGVLGYCSSGCTTDAVCVSTGTINAFVRTSARTTACQ